MESALKTAALVAAILLTVVLIGAAIAVQVIAWKSSWVAGVLNIGILYFAAEPAYLTVTRLFKYWKEG